MKFEPLEVTDLDLVFPADISHLIPDWEDIPDNKKRSSNSYVKVVSKWFYDGLPKKQLKSKPGIDKNKALRHLGVIMTSFSPSHEHKIAAVAHLMSEWFDLEKVK